jgi:Uncharacterized protein conserved in bacteria (DUF2130)
MGIREGIFLIHPSMLVGVVRLMRNFIIENAKQTRINNGVESKYKEIYDYITSPERFRKIEQKIHWKLMLDEQIRLEEVYHQKGWKERKKVTQDWFDSDKDDQKKIEEITQDGDMEDDGQK